MTALKSILYLLVVQNFGFYISLVFYRSVSIFHIGVLAYLAYILWPLGSLGVLWCF